MPIHHRTSRSSRRNNKRHRGETCPVIRLAVRIDKESEYMTDAKQDNRESLPGNCDPHNGRQSPADGAPVPDPDESLRRLTSHRPKHTPKAGHSENDQVLQILRDREAEFRKRLPPWARVLVAGQAAVAGCGNAQSQQFHAFGGPELLTRLCSGDSSARESAENMILADVLSTALWRKKRADGELGALLNHDDRSISDEGLVSRLLALSETQAGRIESTIRTRRSVNQVGPLNLVVKGGDAPLQANINIAAPGDRPHGSERGTPPTCPEGAPTAPSDDS
jgi:hypothetical protein